MTDAETNATAELFKVLGDPARVRIVNMIAVARAPVCACDFYEALGLGQPTVSYHLKKLTDVGLLEREQRGKWAFFSLSRRRSKSWRRLQTSRSRVADVGVFPAQMTPARVGINGFGRMGRLALRAGWGRRTSRSST